MSRYQRRHIPFKILDDVCYVIDSLETKAAYKLNSTSTFLWVLLETPRSESELVSALVDEFDEVSLEEVVRDVRSTLENMKEMSLIDEIK